MSLVIGAVVYIYFESVSCAIASFLTGVFLDLDHVADCYMNHGRSFRLRDLYTYCREVRFKRLSLVFHSYELILVFWVLIFVFSLGDIWKAAAIGATQHIFFDQLANIKHRKMDWRGYFLSFRLKNRFKKERIFKV